MTRIKFDAITRQRVWVKIYGREGYGNCHICQNSEINTFNFEVGHDESIANGGSNDLNNLFPICSYCNKSMGIRNLCKIYENIVEDSDTTTSTDTLYVEKQCCTYKMLRGVRKGNTCGEHIKQGNLFCNKHRGCGYIFKKGKHKGKMCFNKHLLQGVDYCNKHCKTDDPPSYISSI